MDSGNQKQYVVEMSQKSSLSLMNISLHVLQCILGHGVVFGSGSPLGNRAPYRSDVSVHFSFLQLMICCLSLFSLDFAFINACIVATFPL